MVLRTLAAAFVVLVSQGQTINPPDVDFSGTWSRADEAAPGKVGRRAAILTA